MVQYELYGSKVELDIPQSAFPHEETKTIDSLVSPEVEHGYYTTPTDGTQLHYRKYIPADRTKPKAVLVWQHGIQGHSGAALRIPSSGRYTNFALLSREVVKAGYALYALDMRGHGLSEGTPRFYVPTWQTNRDDYDGFARFVASEFDGDDEGEEGGGGIPLFVGGDSYGGCLALHVGRKWQDALLSGSGDGDNKVPPSGFRGLCLLAPAIIAELPPVPVVILLKYVLKPMYPTWRPSFMPNSVSPDQVWSDLEVRGLKTAMVDKQQGKDEGLLEAPGQPLILGTAAELLDALEAVRERGIPGLDVPYCANHGTLDGGVPIEGSEYLHQHAVSNKDDDNLGVFRKVEGARHDLMAEPSAEETMAFLLNWMEQRVDGEPYAKLVSSHGDGGEKSEK